MPWRCPFLFLLYHSSSSIFVTYITCPRPLTLFSWKVLIKQEIQRKSGYAIQVDEEHLRVQLDTIQSELNAPTQFKVSVSNLLHTVHTDCAHFFIH